MDTICPPDLCPTPEPAKVTRKWLFPEQEPKDNAQYPKIPQTYGYMNDPSIQETNSRPTPLDMTFPGDIRTHGVYFATIQKTFFNPMSYFEPLQT